MAETEGKLTRDVAEDQMREAFGFVPGFFSVLPDAAYGAAWALHRDLEMAETKLDQKTKQLIGLVMASQIKCGYCLHYHQVMAREAGATEEEIREALWMGGLTIAYSNALSGMGPDMDDFRRDVQRAVDYARQQKGAPKAPAAPEAHA